MSGDVQPRKRKDKNNKKRRDDEETKEKIATSGVNAAKMGPDDIQLHVHSEHGTGGHWCAKVFFFSLLAVLLTLIALILLENRGLSDLDTPLSESRYADYLSGWVDENRDSHDDHGHDEHELLESLNELDEHEHDNEPFVEVEDHDDDDDSDKKGADKEEEVNKQEDAEEEGETEDQIIEQTTNDENADGNDDEVEEAEEENEIANESDIKSNDADDIDEGFEEENENEDDKTPFEEIQVEEDADDDDFDDDDDDDEENVGEKVVDNDEGEEMHLKKIAQDQAEANEPEEDASQDTSQIKRTGGAQSFDSETEDEIQNANGLLVDNPYKALALFEKLLRKYPNASEILYGKARSLDQLADEKKSNELLNRAIETYTKTIEFGDQLSDVVFKMVADRCIDRIRFIGQHLKAVPIHEALIKRFDNEPSYRNQLAVSYLMANRLLDAKYVLHETLLRWRENGFALVHYGFILKNLDHDMENAVIFLREGIESGADGTNDGRFYFNLGDALQRLGRNDEAQEIFRLGAEKKLFLSQYQRSLYNVDRLESHPFWTKNETTYEKYFNVLEKNWKKIRTEGLDILNEKGYFTNETENLKDRGDWKQFDLYARGKRISKNCEKAPFTCKLLDVFPDARFCTRGQIKFSVMHPGTHVWPHCGPTNCRIRAHLGLKVPKQTYLRVATETRSWSEGKMLIFDDSFEHEVWHNGTDFRLVLIVDVWHPDLTTEERATLQPI